ncbi:MAG: TPM domain-containing protein [Thermosynechococcaceae cyanobacterium]
MANILSAPTELKLNQMISKLEAENSSEIAVVTVPETVPSKSPKTFATQLFNTWGIDKKGKDNGVLFLISKGDRRVEIETGYGIESILPNTEVKQLIDSQILPSLKQDNFDQGVLLGTTALVTALRNKDSGRWSRHLSRWLNQWWKSILFGALLLFAPFFNRGNSGNNHGGSSGGGFGGGSSGGGGAGGSF